MVSNSVSELFRLVTQRNAVYNIVPLVNVPSVMKNGILSYNRARVLPHSSIALADVQSRRDSINVPNGLRLHDYANAYFDPRNPMMYLRRDRAEELCVLAIHRSILDCDGVVVSDGNAASGLTRFFSPAEGIEVLPFDLIKARWWTDEDPYEQENKKRIKCAEVLVPYCIPSSYIMGAKVVNAKVEAQLREQGFAERIIVDPDTFFMEKGV